MLLISYLLCNQLLAFNQIVFYLDTESSFSLSWLEERIANIMQLFFFCNSRKTRFHYYSMNQLTHHWLSTLCRMIKGATRAIVFSPAPDKDSYIATATWPEGHNSSHEPFLPAVEAAFAKKRSVLLQLKNSEAKSADALDIIAAPLFLNEQLYGVIAVQLPSRTPTKQHVAILQIESAAVWLEALITQHSSTEKSQLVTIIELVASCLEHEHFQKAATDVMTDLATRLSCDRVSIGFVHGHGIRVEAVSHNAEFDRKGSLLRDIGEAMNEAMEQDTSILYPETGHAILLSRCHAVLVREHGIGTVLTLPFGANGKITGAVLVERAADRPFDQITRTYFEQIVSLIGPLLATRHRDEQKLAQRIYNSLKQLLAKLFGPGHIALKLSLSSLILCLTILTFLSGDYRITGSARLEAQTQRVVVAPQDGYIAEVYVRPGDIIHDGDILGTLDDKNLTLKQQQWSNQLEQLQTEHRDALARRERSEVSIIKARILQAQAQLALVSEQLARTRLTAPFDGLIVSGDLSQALGSPVERGQILFTTAPLDAYRVVLKIDERDIGNVKKGQVGNLVLSGMPRTPWPFTVEKITPVSIPAEGRNYFHVEAQIKKSSDLLRPGMEGIAKIEIDRRKLIWILSHKLVDWMQLSFWAWRP